MNYIMDTPHEGDRIELKTDQRLTLEQLGWAGLKPGDTVLDLGCAAGTTARMMADLVLPSGRVVGVDASQSRLDQGGLHHKHQRSIEYRLGDAAAIPAQDNEFDLSWSRFLFEYLEHPAQVLNEMIRVTRPGGTVCVSDLDGNCIWHHPISMELSDGLHDALQTLGDSFDPRAGQKLNSLMVKAGLRDIEVDIRPYHTIIGAINQREEGHWRLKLDSIGEALRQRGWSDAKATMIVNTYLTHLRDPQTMTYSVLFTVRGTKV
tara:strand:- start:262658 stop:263443 length:786 start_codon:yes stop_codon:yes gene_type:complete